MTVSDRDSQAPILVAYSPESAGREPVEFGIAASRVTGAPLSIIVIQHGGPVVDAVGGGVPDDPHASVGKSAEHLRQDLRRRKIEADVSVRQSRTAGSGIMDATEELSPAMIVLASTKRSAVGAALLGGTIEHVIHEAKRPVAVVPQGYKRPEGGVQVVGAAYAQTEEGRDALRAAAGIARAGGVRLRAITVLDPKLAEQQGLGMMSEQHRDVDPGQADEARQLAADKTGLKDALAEVAQGVESEIDILYNEPADGLVAASRHVDLLVMGSRARGPRRAAVLGSVSRKVAEETACPVIILPHGTEDATDDLISHVQAVEPS